MADKIVRTKQAEKPKAGGKIAKWWRETIGELRKVSWPTTPDAWRLTKIVLAVMAFMAIILGLLDFVFSTIIRVILS